MDQAHIDKLNLTLERLHQFLQDLEDDTATGSYQKNNIIMAIRYRIAELHLELYIGNLGDRWMEENILYFMPSVDIGEGEVVTNKTDELRLKAEKAVSKWEKEMQKQKESK